MPPYGITTTYISGSGWSAALPILERGSLIEATTTDGEHYLLVAGYTYDTDGVGYVLVVDSSATSVYKRADGELYKYDGTSTPGAKYTKNPGCTGMIYWLKFSDERRLALWTELSQS